MRISLWLKLMGILAVIILAGAVVTFVVVNLATANQFRRFVFSGDLIQAQNLSALLADYYADRASWENVDTLFTSGLNAELSTTLGAARGAGIGPGMMGHDMMGSDTMGPEMMRDMFETMRRSGSLADRVVLADANGMIIADSANAAIGQHYTDHQLINEVPITVNDQLVGTVLVGSMIEPILNPLDQDFLRSVNLAVTLSAVAVGILALVLGSIFFFHITAPVRDLTQAAEAIATSNLSQRVPVRSNDEIGRLAQAFNTMTDALEKAETLRRHMVADIAHELRTPLSLVQGSLEAMLDGMYELNRENVESAHEETLVLSRLVDDLHDLALAESGQLKLEKETVDVIDLVTRAAERYRTQAAEQEVTLVTDLPPDLPHVYGDEQRLGQVLTNLMANALRYTPGQGRVTIRARLATAEDIPQAANIPGQGETVKASKLVLVSISDSGQGIPPEDLPYLFERFYRADKSRARASGGSGLGLAISRQIVGAHGGRIWAESQAGVGSTFRFTLPVGRSETL
jgi:signal transduction histidine kinase